MSSSSRRRLRALAPFLVGAALPFLLVPLSDAGSAAEWIAGAVVTIALAAGVLLAPWDRLPRWFDLVPALGYLAVVALLRDAGGGNASGLGPMVLLPVIWLALHGTRGVLATTLVGVALVYWLPIVVSHGDRYPTSGWKIGALFVALSAILGFTVQRLREHDRRHAGRLAALASTDELTGLPNRRACGEALERALSSARRRGEPVSVALIDIDAFKEVNDTGGHHAGDDLLVSLALTWQRQLRLGDTLARTGGDEFCAVLPGCSVAQAHEAMQRIAWATEHTTCSIGLAEWDGGEDPRALLYRADQALYQAKRGGRDRICSAATGRPAPGPDAAPSLSAGPRES